MRPGTPTPLGVLCMNATFDLFLSYRRLDAEALAPLLAALAAKRVRVWQDVNEVADFASIQRSVSTHLAQLRGLLVWYSASYNASRACQWELTSAYLAAQAEGAQGPRQRILVLNPESSAEHICLPELMDQLHLSCADLVAAAATPQAQALAEALAERIAQALHQLPTTPLGALRALVPPLCLPYARTGSSRFVGRLPEMWRLHGYLQANQAAMLTGASGKPGLAVVQGAGGIGKSLTAEEYTLRFGAAYPGGVFWLNGFGHADEPQQQNPQQRSLMRESQCFDFAAQLGLEPGGQSATQVRGLLARHFAAQNLPFLWVVDDLAPNASPEELRQWQAPHPLGRTLFTTRTRRFSFLQHATLELPQLTPPEARGLLTRQRPLSAPEAATADAICRLLGHHALAVDVTAALVARRGLAGVLAALQHPSKDALALAAQLEEALPNGHQREIAATFLASIALLREPARALLRYAAVLPVEPIPVALLRRCVAQAQGVGEADAQDGVDVALSQLLASCLADDLGEDLIGVHALVSRTLRFAAPPEDLAPLREQVVAALLPEMRRAQDIREHASLAPWAVHARELSQTPQDAATLDMLTWVAVFDLERASYALAKAGFEREYAASQHMLGAEHPATLVCMGNLALTLKHQGDLAGARQLQESVLATQQRVLGAEHPDTLTSMNNLALTLQSQGDLAGARQLQESVLSTLQRVLGTEHPDTLTSMNNLAETLRSQGDLAGARQLQESVLAAQQRVLGAEHPDTLGSMNNLANTLWYQGERQAAISLLEQAASGLERTLGANHSDTQTAMRGLAAMRQQMRPTLLPFSAVTYSMPSALFPSFGSNHHR